MIHLQRLVAGTLSEYACELRYPVLTRCMGLAATTVPNLYHAVPTVCGLLAIEGLLILPIGRASGFLPPPAPPACDFSLAKRSAGAFIIPALLEEALWRAMLLPHPAVDGVLSLRAVILPQCLLFGGLQLLLHPVAGRTVWKRGRDVFDDKRFLALASIVIAASSAAYVATGSLWAAAVVHWLPVVGWREVYGGEELMTSPI